MTHYEATASELIRASDYISGAILAAGYIVASDLSRVTLTFPDLRTLYRFERELRTGLLSLAYAIPTIWPDWRRDETGYIFKDIVIVGVPWRLTTTERTQGFAIAIPDDAPFLQEPGVRRAG